MSRLAVAAHSARLLAELAAADGHAVVALDLFGDRDTRRAAQRWEPLGDAATLRIDDTLLLAALERLRGEGVEAWIAGSGFDGRPDLLAEGARRLPLIGNEPAVVAAVRDPRRFFAALAAEGLAHPPVRFERPDDPAGWLHKDFAGCGGWQVRPATADDAVPTAGGAYFQREHPGRALSATFVADGRHAVVLGANEQIVRPLAGRRFVWHGVVGPVLLPAAVRAQMTHAVQRLVAHFGLCGLGSLDLLCDGELVELLELNPRPPASIALYPRVGDTGVFDAHLRACLQGVLPRPGAADALVRGTQVVFAPRPLRLDARAIDGLAAQPGVHDVPHAPQHCAAGAPLCSLSTTGTTPAEVREQLARRVDALLTTLETMA